MQPVGNCVISAITFTLRLFLWAKLEQDLNPKEIKPSIVSASFGVVYKFAFDLCDADYVGYTARHLRRRIAD